MCHPYKIKFYQTMIRCIDRETDNQSNTPVFDQLMKNDKKYGKNMTETLCQKLTQLLIGDEKCDMASVICSLGSTSALESNHSRIVTRNIHVKGENIL